jgi:hypothetical protein
MMSMQSLDRLLAVTALALTAVTAFNADAPAQTRGPAVMITVDDADMDTIPRGSRNSNRIQRTIAERFITGGFAVYDEAFVVPDVPPPRTSPTPQFLDSVRQAKTKIDVVVVMQVYAWVTAEPPVGDVFRPSIRVDARYLRVSDGRSLGDYSSGRVDLPLIGAQCMTNKECLQQQFGDGAVQFAGPTGDALATKLAADMSR